MKTINWKKHLISAVIFILGFLLIRAYQLDSYVRGPAPLFSAVSISNNVVNLADYRDEPVLIYFWATWCPVCKLHKGSIESLAEDYPVITVASWSEAPAEVANYFASPGLRSATIHDPNGELAQRYGITAVPSFFILDTQGEIRFIERGFTSGWGLRLRLLLAKYL